MGHHPNHLNPAQYDEWNHARYYDLVAEWWTARDQDPPPPELLPCYGAIIFDDDDRPRCAGWFTHDPVNQVAHLDWFVSNPELTLTLKYGMALYQVLQSWANALQVVVIYCQCPDPRMAEAAERAGFTITGSNVTALAMLLTDIESWA